MNLWLTCINTFRLLLGNFFVTAKGLLQVLRFKPALIPRYLNRYKFDAPQLLLATLALLAVTIGTEWLTEQLRGAHKLRFNLKGFESEALYIGALVASNFFATWKLQNKSFLVYGWLCLSSIFLSVFIFESTQAQTWLGMRSSTLLWIQLAMVGWVYWFHASNLRVGLRLSSSQVLLAMLPLVAVFAFHWRYQPEPFWIEAKTQVQPINPANEETLAVQATLLPAQLEALKPQREGHRDVYFLGFAPYSTEDVFKLEMDVIDPLIRQRFDADGRSIRLSNHLQTRTTHAFASYANLQQALKGIAAKMDVTEDVFVMYLTSHGSTDHRIANRFPPFEFKEITAPMLRLALDEAGIKHRVLILSACYAGGFIEALKTPESIIMTAAQADRPSFGCGSTSTFTYFGKALIDEQLRKTNSFEDAFQRALPNIREREKAMGLENSNPQIYIGEQIRPVLKELEAQFAITSN